MEDQPTQEKKSNKMVLIIVIVIVVIGATVGVYFLTQGNEDTTTTTNKATNTATPTNTDSETDPYADLMKYDDKVVKISSVDGKVTGQIALSIDKSQEMPIAAVYFMKVTDALSKSVAASGGSGASYYYIANHATADAVNVGDGTGVLSSAFCNTDQDPNVLTLARARSIDLELYRGCDAQFDSSGSTTTFYHIYSSFYNNYTFDYDEIVGNDTLAVFDSAPYWEADEELGGWGADDATVVTQSEPTATYSLIYTE